MSGIPSTPEIFAFIQARTTSQRLPGKVLMEIGPGNKTILDHLIERLIKILPKKNIVLLIPYGDFALAQFAKNNLIQYVEGPEDDVRERFIIAAKQFGATHILRLTGDNPFIDIEHLELLVESCYNNNYDLISFEGLPLGLGAELFTTEALLKEPDSGLFPRHREHVSLHIKDSSGFQFLKLPAIIYEGQRENISEIRLTVDEAFDLETVSRVSNILYKERPDFGVNEILKLSNENREIFEKNKSVNQIKFSTKPLSSDQNKRIHLVYANPKKEGSGHRERCKFLYLKLGMKGYRVSMGNESEKIPESDLTIFDFRDYEIPSHINLKKVILIDHFGKERNFCRHYDTLPLPESESENTLEKALIPNIIMKYVNYNQGDFILIYAGSLANKDILHLDSYCLNHFSNKEIIRVGGDIPESRFITHIPRISRSEFYEKIAGSKIFITYFGQSAMEAITLDKQILLYAPTIYHDELAKHLSYITEIPYLGTLEKIQDANYLSSKKSCLPSPGNGYSLLLDYITKSLES